MSLEETIKKFRIILQKGQHVMQRAQIISVGKKCAGILIVIL